jgi:tetratricopeptide (TPR) repeat protein
LKIVTDSRVRACVLASSLLFVAAPLRAQSSDTAAAESLFREGRTKMDAKDYAHACPKLEASFRLDPATGTLLALALCYESSGRTASAWAAYADAAARAKQEGRADREKAARARAAALEPKLARLSVALSPAAEQTPGIAVQRDGVSIDAAALGSSIPVDPGDHVIVASAPGKRPWRTTVTVAGETRNVVVPPLDDAAPAEAAKVPPTAQATPAIAASSPSAAAPESAQAPSASSSSSSSSRTVGFVVGGVGLAGIATGAVLLVRAGGLSSQSVDEQAKAIANPADTQSAAAAKADHDAAKTSQLVGFVAGGVGIAALGVGIVLIATSGHDASSPRAASSPRSAWIQPDIAPGHAGIRFGGAF